MRKHGSRLVELLVPMTIAGLTLLPAAFLLGACSDEVYDAAEIRSHAPQSAEAAGDDSDQSSFSLSQRAARPGAIGLSQERAANLDDGASTPGRTPLTEMERLTALREAAALAEQYWREKPFPAAQGLCVEIWRLLATLGDRSAKERLYDLARSEHVRAYSAARALHQAGDLRIVEYWIRLANDPGRPLSERMRATALSGPFYDFGLTIMPSEIEELCLEIIRQPQTSERAARRTRAAAESMARQKCSSDCLQPLEEIIQREVQKGIRDRDLGSASPPACTAGAALDALRKIDDPRSVELYQWLAERGPWPGVRRVAALALDDHGKRDIAVSSVLRAKDQITQSPKSRVSDAYVLVRLGHEESRPALIEAMHHHDESVRESAYGYLCALGDPVFLERASRDYNRHNEPVGFHLLGGQGLAKSEPRRSLQSRYLLSMIESGRNPRYRLDAMGLLFENDEVADLLLAATLPVLTEPLMVLPSGREASSSEIGEWQEHVGRHIAIVRVGGERERSAALERIVRIYEDTGQRHFFVVRQLGRTKYRGAQRFLLEALLQPPQVGEAHVRLFAAISYLAIEAGVVSQH